jgi:hypothetical protein
MIFFDHFSPATTSDLYYITLGYFSMLIMVKRIKVGRSWLKYIKN